MNWYLQVMKSNYANFSGRARRKEYWMYTLFNILIVMALLLVMVVLDAAILSSVLILYYIGIIIPSIAVGVRRLHDVDKSGWWTLINFVPIIGGIWFLILMVTEGKSLENIYGKNPKVSIA